MKKCLGCQLANKELDVNVVKENELFTAILDIDPISDGHTIIIPKKHHETLSQVDEIYKLNIFIVEVKKILSNFSSDFSICINEGEINDLNHVHIHIIPRKKGDELLYDKSNATKKIDEIISLLIK